MSKAVTTNQPTHTRKETLSTKRRKASDEGQGQYVESFPALIDKYLQYIISGNKIPLGIVLIAVGVIFIFETRGEELQTWEGRFWIIQKTLSPVVLYLIFLVSSLGSRVIKKRHDQATRRNRKN